MSIYWTPDNVTGLSIESGRKWTFYVVQRGFTLYFFSNQARAIQRFNALRTEPAELVSPPRRPPARAVTSTSAQAKKVSLFWRLVLKYWEWQCRNHKPLNLAGKVLRTRADQSPVDEGGR
jgi:hypothetical protein